jgi:hypothetical protein
MPLVISNIQGIGRQSLILVDDISNGQGAQKEQCRDARLRLCRSKDDHKESSVEVIRY